MLFFGFALQVCEAGFVVEEFGAEVGEAVCVARFLLWYEFGAY